MLDVRWARSPKLKRMLAVLVLGWLLYSGTNRVLALQHADSCLESGGRYDPNTDTCRR
jgi:hypothetical protein